ncbi:MAG: ABC transporter permease, partial [Pseudomonadales bacterium]|nr:ABC transporter permease [Pseudomonadales bacterium]
VFSCFLLVLTGVFIGASVESAETDYGTATEGYLTARVDIPTDFYTTASARAIFRNNLATELLIEQGVEAVTYTSALPSQGASRRYSYRVGDRDLRVNDTYPRKGVVYVENNYFETMGVSLTAGRSFDNGDSENSIPVVIIDELFAEQLWPNEANPSQAAIGRTLELDFSGNDSSWTTVSIVGVTPHILQAVAMDDINRTSFYQPLSQRCCFSPGQDLRLNVAVKVAGNPQDYRQTLQVAAAQVDRNVPPAFILSLEEWQEGANSVMVFASQASTGIAILTLALAITGIFAIVTRSIRQRTKEIGIRRAVGSSNNNVLWVFIRQGFKYLCVGLIIGGGGAVLISNMVTTESIRLLEWLPLVFPSVSVGLALLVFLSTYGPARELIAMEPGETLRDE